MTNTPLERKVATAAEQNKQDRETRVTSARQSTTQTWPPPQQRYGCMKRRSPVLSECQPFHSIPATPISAAKPVASLLSGLTLPNPLHKCRDPIHTPERA